MKGKNIKAAVISLTEKGRELSMKLSINSRFMSSERFCFHTHSDPIAADFDDLSKLVYDIFDEFNALIFICACGIAVRTIAPFLRSKDVDPAVIVIDDCGRFVVPVLSGHIGRANALAERIATIIGAQAVITTATDIGGLFSPDSFAVANELLITNLKNAKEVAAAVLNGEKIGFVSDYAYKNIHTDMSTDEECDIGIYVGCENRMPFPVTLKLMPKNLVLGIGCKRGTDLETIEYAVLKSLTDNSISFMRISDIATVDIKANEQGLLNFSEKLRVPLTAYSADELMEVSGDFSSSDFVKSITGTDNVCERSAVKCSGGTIILRKTAINGVTVAVAEKPVILDFERKVL